MLIRQSPGRRPRFRRLAAMGLVAAVVGCDGGSDSPSPTVPPPSPAPPPATDPMGARCTEAGRILEYGFFAHFEPISHSASPDPGAAAFNEHLGYEADLLNALEAMDGAGLAFRRRGIHVWPGIWLLSSTPEYDLVGGGITILEERTMDAAGMPAISFTSGHIEFGHSLLVRAADAERLAEYSDLTGDDRVGVSVETTNEARFLQIVELIDEDGVLRAGTRVTHSPPGPWWPTAATPTASRRAGPRRISRTACISNPRRLSFRRSCSSAPIPSRRNSPRHSPMGRWTPWPETRSSTA